MEYNTAIPSVLDLKKVVIVNGYPMSGKNSVIKKVRRFLPTNIHISHISTVDRIKNAARMLGYVGVKDDKERTLLHEIKMASKRFNNGPVVDVVSTALLLFNVSVSSIVFIDCREIDEIEELKEAFGSVDIEVVCKTLFVSREIETGYWGNPSDGEGMERYGYDYYYYNGWDGNENGNGSYFDRVESNELVKFKEWLVE